MLPGQENRWLRARRQRISGPVVYLADLLAHPMWAQCSRHLLVRVFLSVKPDADSLAETCALANFKYIAGLLEMLGAPEGTSFSTNEHRLLHNGCLLRSNHAPGHSFPLSIG